MITHIDWSCDGTVIRTNDGCYDYLFYNMETFKSKVKTDPFTYRDVKWET